MPRPWFPFVEVGAVRDFVGEATLQRARSYARSAVLELNWRTGVLEAEVAGSEPRPYSCWVTLVPAAHGHRPTASGCTCPVGARCKHVAAAMLAGSRRHDASQWDRTAEASGWRGAVRSLTASTDVPGEYTPLALLIEVRERARRRTASSGRWSRTTETFAAATRDSTGTLQVTARIGAPGQRGWIGAKIAWGSLQYRTNESGYDPLQVRWFVEFETLARATPGRYFSGDGARLALQEYSSPLLWRLLADAAARGIRIRSGDKNGTIVLADGAEFQAVASTRDDGALVLAPALAVDGRTVTGGSVQPIGDHGVAVVEWPEPSPDIPRPGPTVTLAPAARPIAPQLLTALRRGDIEVPADEVAEFAREAYPTLARTLPIRPADARTKLPELAPPVLVVTVSFRAKQTVTVAFGWEYRAGDDVTVLPAVASTGDRARRDAAAEAAATAAFAAASDDWADGDVPLAERTLRGVDAAEWVENVLPVVETLGDGIRVDIVGERVDYHELTETPELTVTTVPTYQNDWFDLGIMVTVAGRTIPFQPLFEALATGRRKLLLVDHSYLKLNKPVFDRLKELLAEAEALAEWETGPRISRYQAALWADFEDLADEALPATEWRETVGGLLRVVQAAERDGAGAAEHGDAGAAEHGDAGTSGRDDAGTAEHGEAGTTGRGDVGDEGASVRVGAAGSRQLVEHTPLPSGLTVELRPYQRDGYDWLVFLWRHGLGGVLADDMGLGKTVQTLALIAHAVNEAGDRARFDRTYEEMSADGVHRDGCPAERPESEADTAAPFLVVAPASVVSNWASEAARFTPGLRVASVVATRRKDRRPMAEVVAGADIVLTSYTVFRLDHEEFAAQQWAGLVLDEAQFVKNHASQTHRLARELDAPFRLAVTGTPLENNLLELWAMFSIVAPGLFPSRRHFIEEYAKPIAAAASPVHGTDAAHGAARLARLRRRIRPLLLRRTKQLVAPELPPKQEQVLSIPLDPKHRRLYDTWLQRERQKVLGLLDDLDRQRFIVFRSITLLRMLALDAALVDPDNADVPSSKLDALLEQLGDVIAEGHRTLVFSQFTSYLAKVAARLDAAGIRYAYLDGSTRRRAEVIRGFREGDAPVFLISLKAGGFGLNLTEADYVFLLDPWWNPAAEQQAIDRTHRIGQQNRVMVYRMVAEGTIEEKVMKLAGQKAELIDAVLDDDGAFSASLTADDIRSLLA
jgi:superfamily II DNA or RNA helicase